MEYHKVCEICSEDFIAYRSDQSYCSDHCRNLYNNRKQAAINAPYQIIVQKLKQQDELLKFYAEEPNALFHLDYFEKYGIKTDLVSRVEVDEVNKVTGFVFAKYKLEHVGNSLFKIVKL